MKKWILTLSILSTSYLFAFPLAPINALEEVFPERLEAGSYDFDGIVKLSNCSGSLIKFSGQPDSAPALVLTNGHCLGGRLMRPDEVVHHQPVNRMMMVADIDMKFRKVETTHILYATMTGTDVALYQLRQTYADLKKLGINSLMLDHQMPIVGTPIEIISGYWERGYQCDIDGLVFELREHVYTFLNAIRYSSPGCEIIGGTSGSPVIAKGTRTVVGVNNTTNESGGRCTLNNPCEVDDQGNVNVIPRAGYGQQTYLFYGCLTADFRIDLDREECGLPKPKLIEVVGEL